LSYLLDTNVVSETIRRQQNKLVIRWLEQIPAEALFVSVLTLGELRKGIERLADKKRREKLRLWLEHKLTAWFEGRVIPIDLAVAERWGRLLAEVNRSVPTIDSLLAATALHYELRLVMRNAKDFDYPGLEVINPWQNVT
jgi:predicted nucleic acid-binding protein